MTDERLLKNASRGDEAAFLVLYQRHRDAVFRFAYRLTGAVAVAEDVTHDCFLSLIRAPARFDPARAALRTYLYAAARNLSLKHLRASGAQQVTIEDLSEEPSGPEAEQPLRQLLAEELSAEVRKAIASLPPLQREALILFEYEELTLAEIAEVIGADTGVVKSRLHRARRRLRELLAPYLSSDGQRDAAPEVTR
ncbi:MAG TPA: sigma-70 family RNA polymerase sigma factor [Pyrinomonadaceae bacterium]|jgi:RNA polymerase sigma-70 factor (ECF subfamily)